MRSTSASGGMSAPGCEPGERQAGLGRAASARGSGALRPGGACVRLRAAPRCGRGPRAPRRRRAWAARSACAPGDQRRVGGGQRVGGGLPARSASASSLSSLPRWSSTSAGRSASLASSRFRLGWRALRAWRSADRRRRCASASARARRRWPSRAIARMCGVALQVVISARASATRRARVSAVALGSGELRFQAFVRGKRRQRRFGLGQLLPCFGELVLGAAARLGDGGELALGLARLRAR